MLSSERYHKRKSSYRQRSRIAPLANEAVPRSVPIEQLPFPEHMQFLSYDAVHTPPLFPPAGPGEYLAPPHETFQRIARGGQPFPFSSSAPAIPPAVGPVNCTQQFVTEQKTEEIASASIRSRGSASPSLVIAPGGGRTPPSGKTSLRGRRLVVHSALSFLFLFLALGATMALMPVDAGNSHEGSTFPFTFHIASVHKNDTVLITAQEATATAVTVDGYDPGGGHVYAGVKAAPVNIHLPAADYGRLSQFFYGQCTYWANMRYHQLTGHWIPWLGNAYQWAYQAPAYGWTISDTPNPMGQSIMVFSPYAQGAGAYGHVAVVERINADGSVLTSNWNWNGDWATFSMRTFYPGRGISFIWYPN
ncbi:CHAP domain-containing protein [Dictyobacter aurantiacus]|uniref:CHAP domain-containing protein n=1 Tax=Dictyobacter aurantiacus TaxID=1936993 RepID=UPI000F817539|nr:CHAP domain-containing protein [Dictyobacter aurantiacus]